MLVVVDPAELKPADVYRQARLVDSKTSRGRDSGWYKDPFELTYQWHLWFDGGREVCSATFSRQDNLWRPGPAISLSNLTTGDGVSDLLAELLAPAHFGQRPKALGVILHVADEFALADVIQGGGASGDSGENLDILHFNLIDDPCEVLADREVSVATTSWRLLPFWGAGPDQERCTAIALSRSREAFLRNLLDHGGEWRVPIRVAVTAAAVEALAAMPLIQPTLEGGRLIAVSYLKFTAVFAITPAGELRSVRSLLHRGNALVPTGLGDILWNMAISAELTKPTSAGGTPPQVLFVSSNPAALQAATKDLETYSLTRQPIRLETMDISSHPALEAIPGHRPEFLVYDPAIIEQVRSGVCPLAKSETFTALWKSWMAKSNFFDTAKLDSIYPTFKDLRLLRLSTFFVYLVALILLGSGAYGAYSLITAMNHPSWALTPQAINLTAAAQVKILLERHQIDVTNRLLLSRSRGWVALEFLLQLFPEDSGVRLDSFSYSIEASRPTAPAVSGQQPVSTGFTRTWTLQGLAKTQALELLNNLNSQRGLNALFDRVAKATGDPSYVPDASRLMTVAQTQGRNSQYNERADPADFARNPLLSFPFNFEMTITQAITDQDALALPAEKPL